MAGDAFDRRLGRAMNQVNPTPPPGQNLPAMPMRPIDPYVNQPRYNPLTGGQQLRSPYSGQVMGPNQIRGALGGHAGMPQFGPAPRPPYLQPSPGWQPGHGQYAQAAGPDAPWRPGQGRLGNVAGPADSAQATGRFASAAGPQGPNPTRLQRVGAGLRGQGLSGPSGWGQGLTRGGLGLGIGVAGQMAGDAAPDNSLAQQFLHGAGTGGGLGMMLGPKGALLGAGVGGLANVGLGLFRDRSPEEEVDPLDQIQDWFTGVGLNSQYGDQLMQEYNALVTLGYDEDEALENLRASVIPMLHQQQSQEQFDNQAIAMQAAAQEFMAPYMQNMMQRAELTADSYRQRAASAPDHLKALYEHEATNVLDRASRTGAAYASQIALAPATRAQQQFQQQTDNMANQMMGGIIGQGAQQGLANMGMGGGLGGGGLNDVLTAELLAEAGL